ncbi:MAG: hypothetical protein ACLFRI_07725 [Candidatus Izemoplasmataceae bacterium]
MDRATKLLGIISTLLKGLLIVVFVQTIMSSPSSSDGFADLDFFLSMFLFLLP